jgi:hypothetical protein
MYIGLHVKYPLFLSDFNETWTSASDFQNIYIYIYIYLNIKFLENPSSGSRLVPYGQTDMAKVTVAFRNLAKAPKKFFLNEIKISETFAISGR